MDSTRPLTLTLEDRVRAVLAMPPDQQQVSAMLDLVDEAVDEAITGTDAEIHPLRHVAARPGGRERVLLAGHQCGRSARLEAALRDHPPTPSSGGYQAHPGAPMPVRPVSPPGAARSAAVEPGEQRALSAGPEAPPAGPSDHTLAPVGPPRVVLARTRPHAVRVENTGPGLALVEDGVNTTVLEPGASVLWHSSRPAGFLGGFRWWWARRREARLYLRMTRDIARGRERARPIDLGPWGR